MFSELRCVLLIHKGDKIMSTIEQLIGEIEEFIDGCKLQPFSSTKIIVDKAQLEELLVELRHRTPEEIKKYQKLLSNKEAIIADAKAHADAIISAANVQTNELINQHEIMQRAYTKANEIVAEATVQARDIINHANIEADNIRTGAISYTDEMLNSLQLIISHTMENTQSKFDSFMNSMKSSYDIIIDNRRELQIPEPSDESNEEVADN